MSETGKTDILLKAVNISKSFRTGSEKIQILKDVNLQMDKGGMTAVVGASGSGKTTLLHILGTLDTPDSGSLLFNGDNLCTKKEGELALFRNRSLGFIFQFHHLLPEFTALENVMMPGLIMGKRKEELHKPAMELLAQVELDQRSGHRPGEMSGGEQQRTALARALIMKPSILLADEPTGNLDPRSGGLVFDLLRNLCRELSLTTIMVTHNRELAERMDSIHTLRDGKLFQETACK